MPQPREGMCIVDLSRIVAGGLLGMSALELETLRSESAISCPPDCPRHV